MAALTKIVIPVAGLGTRVLPASKVIPKEMLTVVDKPVIQYVIEEAIGALLPHLFGHDIHHRGQIHAMMAGAAVKPPQLDDFWLDYGRAPEAVNARLL